MMMMMHMHATPFILAQSRLLYSAWMACGPVGDPKKGRSHFESSMCLLTMKGSFAH